DAGAPEHGAPGPGRRAAQGLRRRPSALRVGRRSGSVSIRTVTVDLWGTLLHDPPSSDDRHKPRRLAEFTRILESADVSVDAPRLDRAYQDSAAFLAQIWMQNRDVPVSDHVRAILIGYDPKLVGRLAPETHRALVEAYSRPALLAPPAVA